MKFLQFVGKLFTSHIVLKLLAACLATVCTVILFAVV